ncbi:MAG: Hsp20/alpha crystallin family protein [Bacteroidales bacterium]|nr:Hsp20/alpha crystallin family protein [Bacteroidales bacterium]
MLFNDLFDNNWIVKTNVNTPAINVMEDEKGYDLELAAPGMTKEDFSVRLDDQGDLVIKMEKKAESNEEKKQGRYLRHEFSYTRFQQTRILPDDVERENITAEVQNGILRVSIPKIQKTAIAEARKVIEVK